jgi:ribosomal protein S12 methylthiotransferase accessory factor
VERDAVALWWYNMLRRPGVDLHAFNEPYLAIIEDHYARTYRRKVWALDLTSDLGIPVFVALSADADNRRIMFGFGCHLDGRIALQRSFAEMNQMVVSFNSMASDGDSQEADLDAWLRDVTTENQAYLTPDADRPRKRLADYPVQHSGDFLSDIEHCRALVEAQGMEMLVLDQTRVDVGLPVVKVVVPGLRHFWARYAPGRLYDVPVRMGLLPRPLREEDLNPIPIFI